MKIKKELNPKLQLLFCINYEARIKHYLDVIHPFPNQCLPAESRCYNSFFSYQPPADVPDEQLQTRINTIIKDIKRTLPHVCSQYIEIIYKDEHGSTGGDIYVYLTTRGCEKIAFASFVQIKQKDKSWACIQASLNYPRIENEPPADALTVYLGHECARAITPAYRPSI